MAAPEDNCGISDIEVVSAFEAYEIEHRDGVLDVKKSQPNFSFVRVAAY